MTPKGLRELPGLPPVPWALLCALWLWGWWEEGCSVKPFALSF